MEDLKSFSQDKLRAVLNCSYSPFSKFRVASCIESVAGNFYYGCNVENSTYGATICAERTALVKMVSEEGPEAKIKKVYILSDVEEVITPCGICRQSLFEFLPVGGEDVQVVSYSQDFADSKTYSVQSLLPEGFKL